VLADGEIRSSGNFTRSSALPLQPLIFLSDNGGGDTVTVDDIIVEPIGGSF
jgi:hypothetical protein